MPASFSEILNSRSIKFIVGSKIDGSPTEFDVHEEALAHLSKPLYTLLKESEDGNITWDNVSKDTFERFAQFAYTGDYSIPETEPRKKALKKEVLTNGSSMVNGNGFHHVEKNEKEIDPGTPIDPEQPREVSDLNGVPVEPAPAPTAEPAKKKKKKKKKNTSALAIPAPTDSQPQPQPQPLSSPQAEPQTPSIAAPSTPAQEPEPLALTKRADSPSPSLPLSVEFNTLTIAPLAPRIHHQSTLEPFSTSSFSATESYVLPLTAHASLYNLASAHEVLSLQHLTLYKLHKTLTHFEVSDETAGDIAALAKCTYAYTDADSGGAVVSAGGDFGTIGSDDGMGTGMGIGGLRGLVCRYMAVHARRLCFNEEFMALLEGGGLLVRDFFRFQVQRVG